MANEASAMLGTVAGKVVVFDVCFLRDTKASHTLTATADRRIHVYVDVGYDSKPVALTLIHRAGVDDIRYIKLPKDNTEPLYRRLSALAAKIVALDKKGILKGSVVSVPRTIRWR